MRRLTRASLSPSAREICAKANRRKGVGGNEFCNLLPPSTSKRLSAVLAIADNFVLKFTRQ
jgi:hypothetical protein